MARQEWREKILALDAEIATLRQLLADLPAAAAEGWAHEGERRAEYLMSVHAVEDFTERLAACTLQRERLQKELLDREIRKLERVPKIAKQQTICDTAHALLMRVKELADAGNYAAALHAARCRLSA